jgi:hypothetical protein
MRGGANEILGGPMTGDSQEKGFWASQFLAEYPMLIHSETAFFL